MSAISSSPRHSTGRRPSNINVSDLSVSSQRVLSQEHVRTPSTPHGKWEINSSTVKAWKELFREDDSVDNFCIQKSVLHHIQRTLARNISNLDQYGIYQAIAYSVRDRLIAKWDRSQISFTKEDPKRVYYMSLEFLMGRTLDNSLLSMGIKTPYSDALGKIGFCLEDCMDEEGDAALGNGGLGRLAACFMDSLANLDYPAWGYGIRYNYGIFQQKIVDGYQIEFPDYWLTVANPWEIERLDVVYEVQFYGYVDTVYEKVIIDNEETTIERKKWLDGHKVLAVAYDYPIPGFGTNNCNNLRLWSSKPKTEFDFASFNAGNYEKSVQEQNIAESISSVLYPNDNHMEGKVLRLKQQYFFVTATLRDIIRRFKKKHSEWSYFSQKVCIQLNDTHPTLGVVELQRILVDEEHLSWDEAWNIVTSTFSYTNHTVLPEALEKWSVAILSELLPRHIQIIYDINLFFLQKVESVYPGDREKLRRMSIIEEGSPQHVRMANLAVIGSHTINGVAELHSELVKKDLFPDFVEFFEKIKNLPNPPIKPKNFINITNGVTPRRWLYQANPLLADLITVDVFKQKIVKHHHCDSDRCISSSKLKFEESHNKYIIDQETEAGYAMWLKNLSKLSELKDFAENPEFVEKWDYVKQSNKARFADYVREYLNIEIDPESLFDVQCKRFHEYKRQFMNILSVIYAYKKLKELPDSELTDEKVTKRTVLFSGKAAPGYMQAKLIIKLINSVAEVINKDKRTSKYLKLVFIPNYSVSIAEILIPASDISQHISTAGTEASGTSNMKFSLNGGLLIGTVDGANIEIGEEGYKLQHGLKTLTAEDKKKAVKTYYEGNNAVFFFGKLTEEVEEIRHAQQYGCTGVKVNSKIAEVIQMIQSNTFGDGHIYVPLIDSIRRGDFYLLNQDFDSYWETMKKATDLYRTNRKEWFRRSIMATASMGRFSSDRSIEEYAERIWKIKKVPVSASGNEIPFEI